MHLSKLLLTAAVCAMLPASAAAQTPETPPVRPNTTGWFDFGVRGTSFDGDGGRYERYRDLGNGLFLQQVRISRDTGGWVFTVFGDQLARRDQRVVGTAIDPGRFKVWGMWDQIPMLMSRTTRTLYVEDADDTPSVLTIPDPIQQTIQAQGNSALPGLFDANGINFDTRSRRHTGQGGFEFLASEALTVRSQVQFTNRRGSLPYGGSFGHSSLVEFPAPIRHNLTDFDSSAEFVRGRLFVRGGFTGSWFHNDITAVTFENPFRATDTTSASSAGRLSLPPSNSLLGVNGLVSVTLPRRSRASAYVSVGSLQDAGDPLMPITVNTATLNAGTLQPLPRSFVNGEARTMGANLSFTTRPTSRTDATVRFRSYDYDNRTPVFVLPQRVAYDNAPSTATYSRIGGGTSPLPVETEPFGVVRRTFDADFRVRPAFGTAGIGYSRVDEDRSHRFYEQTSENIVRVTFDALGTGLFSVRTKYEHGRKRADASAEELREAQMFLFDIGEQPAMRHFDIAERDRNRVTVLGTVTPFADLVLNGSIAAGKDDYIESIFGLRDNTHLVYSAGFDSQLMDDVNVGLSYSFERYVALLHSRSASPPSGASAVDFDTFLDLFAQPTAPIQVADRRADWANEGRDRVHSLVLTAEILGIGDKVDARLSYDLNRARSFYTYTTGPDIPRVLPEEVPPPDVSLLPPPEQLPPVRSDLHRGTLDVTYSVSERLGLGLSFWHERYRVSDFTLDIDANPELARGSALLLGYLYLPYTANTVWGRVIVKF